MNHRWVQIIINGVLQAMNLQTEINSYLHNCKYHKKLSAKTLKAYSIDLQQFYEYQCILPEQQITKTTVLGYIKELHQGCKPRTAKRKLASLRAFLNHLEFEEILEVNPIHKIRTKFQEPKELPKTIPFSTIETILSIAHKERIAAETSYQAFSALRDVALLETLFATGVRISELCSLKVSDVNLDDGTILISGKGSKERIIQIGNEEVLGILRRYRKAVDSPSDSFFINRFSSRFSEQSARSMICKLKDKAGIQLHITPHMFRHSFATLLLEEDVDIRYIQTMLGHSSIKTTQIYTQVTAGKQRQILTTKHPRNKIKFD